jgi:hypothetical protein
MATEPGFDDLKEVEEQIDKAKDAADEAVGRDRDNMFTDADPAFVDSGDASDIDDQTIAPPG